VFRGWVPPMNKVNARPGDIHRPEQPRMLFDHPIRFENRLLKLSAQVLFARDKKAQNDKPYVV